MWRSNRPTVRIRFSRAYPEQLYDATWHVRIFPAHVWKGRAPGEWATDTSTAALIGSGPYRIARWDRGQSLTLERAAGSAARIGRVVWRFADSPEAAANLVLAHEADALEVILTARREFRSTRAWRSGNIHRPFTVPQFPAHWPGAGARVRLKRWRGPDEQLARPSSARHHGARQANLGNRAVEKQPVAPLDTVKAGALLDAGWRRRPDGICVETDARTVDILVPARVPRAGAWRWPSVSVSGSNPVDGA
jgi:hypothetical protein